MKCDRQGKRPLPNSLPRIVRLSRG
jgi:hypothetical protein